MSRQTLAMTMTTHTFLHLPSFPVLRSSLPSRPVQHPLVL
ncbi:hypothetical protein DNTS_006380 [Danionella cerebrum]|uniref:Uncharacterized protein n=1 Tax=Danionella cerebrum TaxID=2873325 RepID=A0A553RPD2_9TELE|nr:hypothetical protein DNTS_006380 [Danionella translucida]